MTQLSKTQSVIYHFYPGIIITLGFVILTPLLHFPPQFSLLIAIALIAIPVMIVHLVRVKRAENKRTIWEVNGYTNTLPTGRLISYSIALVIFSFLIWGITQPLNLIITEKFFSWLPSWYTVQDFHGYDEEAIRLTLILNLLLNGFLAPVVEEFYFRGYLLARMEAWGKWSPAANAVLFSLYHFWQPYIYLTLILAMMPMTYLVWKTKDLRLAIVTHCLLNLVGAILSFGLLMKG